MKLDLQFPIRLKALRVRAHLTMAEMARAAGLKGASSWQRYESAAFTKDYLPPEVAVRLGPADQADAIPVYGAARGGGDQEMHLDGRPIDWVLRPPFLRNVRQAYAMQVLGDSMRPMYRAGQLLYVNPFRVARPEMGVVIYKRNGAVLVKELVRRTAARLVVQEYQPKEREFALAADDIQTIHTVVGSREP